MAVSKSASTILHSQGLLDELHFHGLSAPLNQCSGTFTLRPNRSLIHSSFSSRSSFSDFSFSALMSSGMNHKSSGKPLAALCRSRRGLQRFAAFCRSLQVFAADCSSLQVLAADCSSLQVLAGVGRCWQVLAGLCSFPPKRVVPAITRSFFATGVGRCLQVLAALCRCWQVLAALCRCLQVFAGLCRYSAVSRLPPKPAPAALQRPLQRAAKSCNDLRLQSPAKCCKALQSTAKSSKTCKALPSPSRAAKHFSKHFQNTQALQSLKPANPKSETFPARGRTG
jgi:hypothetical protein